ncbi:MAG TPA: N-acetyl-gamma-glutamyl-phosphate reductase [Candidatus Limnocylindrales bacterium]|nr:N-acetyl-gamma-glutamyl-phosphate reductase [Candidatus Limnocylindrales bacterium]
MSAGLEPAGAIATDRRPGSGHRIRVGIIGATGYVGAELVRLLARHPHVEIVGLQARGRDEQPIGATHGHLATTGLTVDDATPEADAVFLALPHGTAAALVPSIAASGTAVIDLGPDFRLRDPADYPAWYGFEHPSPELLDDAVYGLPELHRAELASLRTAPRAIVGAPGCYPTATLLALAPLARAGLIGDLVVDAKSGVSGAGRDPKPEMMFGEVNESVKAYGTSGHRHVAEIEQELAWLGSTGGVANPGAAAVDFLPHLIPMSRGILSACHVRPTRAVDQAELDRLYADAYADEPFVTVVDAAPATKHVTGSNHARVFVHHDPRTDRILAIGVVDNLVKGAAGQAVQAFNLVHGLAETAGLEQLPLAP